MAGKNLDGQATAWEQHIIANRGEGRFDTSDIDQDGDMDVSWHILFGGKELYLYENNSNALTWTETLIQGYPNGFGKIRITDADQDGSTDILLLLHPRVSFPFFDILPLTTYGSMNHSYL